MARLVAYAHAGVDPKYMGIGPVPAVEDGARESRPQDRATWTWSKSNEAFAAQALRRGERPRVRHEENQSQRRRRSASGHPIGATGCILTVKALYELQRTGGRYALVTMCIGGGQGIAAIFENLH